MILKDGEKRISALCLKEDEEEFLCVYSNANVKRVVQSDITAYGRPTKGLDLIPSSARNKIMVSALLKMPEKDQKGSLLVLTNKGTVYNAHTEKTLLGKTTKQEFKDRLIAKYDKNFFAYPGIEKDPLFKEYALNDTRVTKELYDHLKPKVPPELNRVLQDLQTKLAHWQAKGIPFPRAKIETKLKEMRIKFNKTLEEIVDIRIKGSKDSLKGWGSPKCITNFINNHRLKWIKYLEETPKTKLWQFRTDDRDRLVEAFPTDNTLILAYKLLLQEHIIQNYEELLHFADGNILRPQFTMLGAASGRFTSSEPGLHNLKARAPKHIFDKTESPDDYNVRNNLLEADNVFSIDLSNQEDRMSARYS